ncbi:uncharacterized protein LY79DRAFT_584661 [Colletotrichum navitas]|uniref:Uncharacterized protein n=1 Tax=Colletotrichum navitas TaxID=681940 RepID=A0AAD8UZ42_9PEZI|nr:uncharacterized protein LY79DRAFT_584661 [Colletotrichum navitas]KAK1569553.1 hypothetical protein LY79DRAFT_584661 [Colletotrichum navitas]
MPVDPEELSRVAAEAATHLEREDQRRQRRERRRGQQPHERRAGRNDGDKTRRSSPSPGGVSHDASEASHTQLVLKTCVIVFKCLLWPCRLVKGVLGRKWVLVPATIAVCVWCAALFVEGVLISAAELATTLHLGWLLSAAGFQTPTARTANGPAAVPHSTGQVQGQGYGADLAVRDSDYLGQVRDMSSNIQYLSQIQVYSQVMSPVARFISDSFRTFVDSSRQTSFTAANAHAAAADNLGEEWSQFWSGISMRVNTLSEQNDQYKRHVSIDQVGQYRQARLLLRRIQTSSTISGGQDNLNGLSWTSPRSWPTWAPRYLWAELVKSWKLVAGQIWVSTEQQALMGYAKTLASLIESSKASGVHLASIFSDEASLSSGEGNDSRARRPLHLTLCEVEHFFQEALDACDWKIKDHLLEMDGARTAAADVEMTTKTMTTRYGEYSLAAAHLTGYQSAGAVLCVGGMDTWEVVGRMSDAAGEWVQTLDRVAGNVDWILERLERRPMKDSETGEVEAELVHYIGRYMEALEDFVS